MMHTDEKAANRICPNCDKPLVPKPGHTETETAKRTFCDIRCYRQQNRKRSRDNLLSFEARNRAAKYR